jgi:hypothetical protein
MFTVCLTAFLLFLAYQHLSFDWFVALWFGANWLLVFFLDRIEDAIGDPNICYMFARVILGSSLLVGGWFFAVFVIGLR